MERIRDFVFDHRRPLAAACAALAVLTALRSLQPSTDTVSLTVVAHDVESGRVLTEGDLTTVEVAPGSGPDHVLAADEAVGRRVAGPMRSGEAVTDHRVLSPRGLDEDTVLSMVRIDDPASLIGLQVGDRVDVVSTAGEHGAAVVVEQATVATPPTVDDGSAATVGLSTSADDALSLADVAVEGGLRLLVSGS